MQATNRYFELDGLRGVAAFCVFLSHAIAFFPQTPAVLSIRYSPAGLLWDGPAAVELFFVLSGFVLFVPYLAKDSGLNYINFVIKRLFRIYPAYWFALALSILLKATYQPEGMAGLSAWALSQWTEPTTLQEIGLHILLIVKADVHRFDNVIWSLVREMKMSLVLPILYIISRRKWSLPAKIAGLAMLVGLIGTVEFFRPLPPFLLGMVLAFQFRRLTLWCSSMSRVALTTALLSCVVLYGNRYTINWGSHLYYSEAFEQLISDLASCGIILFVTQLAPAKRGLTTPVVHFLGRVSYSFYLLHLPILTIIASYLYPQLSSVWICSGLTLLIILPLSYLVYTYIELPCIPFGRQVASRLKGAHRPA